jgi:hypothetical protein
VVQIIEHGFFQRAHRSVTVTTHAALGHLIEVAADHRDRIHPDVVDRVELKDRLKGSIARAGENIHYFLSERRDVEITVLIEIRSHWISSVVLRHRRTQELAANFAENHRRRGENKCIADCGNSDPGFHRRRNRKGAGLPHRNRGEWGRGYVKLTSEPDPTEFGEPQGSGWRTVARRT